MRSACKETCRPRRTKQSCQPGCLRPAVRNCAYLLVSTAPGCGTDTSTATPLLHPTNSLLLSPLQQQQAGLLSPSWQATTGSNCSCCAVGSSSRMNTPPSAATAAQWQPSLLTAMHTTATCRHHVNMHTRRWEGLNHLSTVHNMHVCGQSSLCHSDAGELQGEPFAIATYFEIQFR